MGVDSPLEDLGRGYNPPPLAQPLLPPLAINQTIIPYPKPIKKNFG